MCKVVQEHLAEVKQTIRAKEAQKETGSEGALGVVQRPRRGSVERTDGLVEGITEFVCSP